jgi:peptidyl-prolyl cis-trans isomerase SurA
VAPAIAAVLWAAAAEAPATPVDGIAAVVGNDIILVSEVRERAQAALDQAMRTQSAFIRDQQVRDVLLSYLETMVTELLIQQEATRLMLAASDEEIDRTIEGVKQQNGWDDLALENQIARRGQSMAQYREETRIQVLKFKVIQVRLRGRIRPSEEDIERAYRQMVRSSRSGDRFEAAHVLLRIRPGATALEVQQIEDRAAEIALRAREGEDFGELARRFSEDPETASADGSLGVLGHDDLPAALDDELVMLDVGEVAGPVRGPSGYHVLKLVAGPVTGVRSFEEVRRGIENRLLQEAMQRQEEVFVQGLRRRTYVDVRLR